MFEIRQTTAFVDWLDALRDPVSRKAIGKRLALVEAGLLGDHRSVGDRVSELRFHTGPGYRVYYTMRGRVLIILLCGGSKRTQENDIKRAKALESELE